jgi:hypothetical protein
MLSHPFIQIRYLWRRIFWTVDAVIAGIGWITGTLQHYPCDALHFLRPIAWTRNAWVPSPPRPLHEGVKPHTAALCESYHVTAVLTIQHPTRSSPGKRKTNIHFISFYKHFMSFGVPYPGWGDGVPMASLHNLWSSCRPCHGSGEENHHLSGTSPAQKRNRWTLNKLDPCWTSSTSNLLIFVCLRVLICEAFSKNLRFF